MGLLHKNQQYFLCKGAGIFFLILVLRIIYVISLGCIDFFRCDFSEQKWRFPMCNVVVRQNLNVVT